jgi:hypothetical protein
MQCQQFFAQGGPGFRIGYHLVDRKISQSTDRRAQPYNRGVENSGEENAVASIDRVLSCAKIAGAIAAVFGWWMGPTFFRTMLDSAPEGIAPIPSCDRRPIRFAGFSLEVFCLPMQGALGFGRVLWVAWIGAWIYDVAARSLGIEFEIVELSSRSWKRVRDRGIEFEIRDSVLSPFVALDRRSF